MSKITKLLDDLNLTRGELKELIREANIRVDRQRPFYIKEIWKSCSKVNCWCQGQKKHGPYMYVVWTENKRQQQRSLGPKASEEDIRAIRDKRKPDWMDFILTGKALKKSLADPEISKHLQERGLNPVDFERFYGMAMDEDGLGRPRSITYNWHAYEAAVNLWTEEQNLSYGPWSHFGVINAKGVAILDALITRGYFYSY